jgi:hypothetical protein
MKEVAVQFVNTR